MAISIDDKYRPILIDVLNDYLYKVSIELNELKGQPLTKKRKELSKKQRLIEELRNKLSSN
jgi:hypothetical protein